MRKFKFVIASLLLAITTAGVASCGNRGGETKEFIDYAHNGSATLLLDYEGKDFFKDGVGQVSLLRHIDGDTDHFSPLVTATSKETIKSRYYGIDTPESTGRIQEWGAKASAFTKEKITNADKYGTIVVTGASLTKYQAPEHDSTGERYVCLVWINETIKNAPKDKLTCLNLWIIQEGFSWVKGTEKIPEYSDIFMKAAKQAEAFKKNMYSGPDPDFNRGAHKDISILELKEEIIESIKDSSHENIFNGEKVRVVGNVAGYSNNTLFLQDEYEVEENGKLVEKSAAINIYCGMKAPSSIYTRINTRLSVPANAIDSEVFGFQLTGVEGHFLNDPDSATDTDVKILAYPQDNVEKALKTYVYTAEELSNIAGSSDSDPKKFESLNCNIQLTTSVIGSRFYKNDKGDELTINFKNMNFNLYVTNVNWVKLDPSQPNYKFIEEKDWVGRKFNILKGVYTWHRTTSGKVTYQIILIDNKSIEWVQE